PHYWVAPHAALNALDLDGPGIDLHKEWLELVHEATTEMGAPAIPIDDHPTYGRPTQGRDLSFGGLATLMGHERNFPACLTFEFDGPGPYPSPNDPDRATMISRRKHLGRYEDNTQLADQYYRDYLPALVATF